MLVQYISLLRPHQYIKNLFIFLPIFFGLKGLEIPLIGQLIITFIAFSSVASAVYILNDLLDIKHDQAHPVKKNRPIASGAVSPRNAVVIGALLALFGLSIAYFQHLTGLFIIYIGLNILYSIKLKHVPIIDVFIISIGFVIRVVVGSVIGQVELSMWIVIMTFLLALFLALSKRKGDIVDLKTNHLARPVLDEYNQEFLSICMAIMAAVVIVSYIMYTTSASVIEYTQSHHVYLTAIFVLFGILRYLKITLFDKNSGNPTKVLFKDSWLQLSILGWISSFIFFLYR